MLDLNPDTNILDSGPLFYKLQHVLDDGNRWRSFLEVVPSSYGSNDLAINAEIDGQKSNVTPAKSVLLNLGSKGVTLNMIIEWLEKISMESALMFLKEFEPVIIIEQPKANIQIHMGSNLELTCKAKAFPSPSYQWFKGEEELLLQQEPTLTIHSVQLEDSGFYVCRVHTFSVHKELSCVFSECSSVEVIASSALLHVPLQSNVEKMVLSSGTIATSQDILSCDSRLHSIENETEKILKPVDTNDNSYYFEIIQQPKSPGKVAQGSSIILECKARSSKNVKYQWYCNGRMMAGESGNMLSLLNLYPDPETGEMKWYYHCEVSNGSSPLLSHSVYVSLDSADESVSYYAEDKVALLIANDTYDNLSDLGTPANDVATLSQCLKLIDFKVLSLKNLTYIEMKNVIQLFCQSLCKNAYVLVYYSGHGFEQFGQSYFQPTDCSSLCSPSECICAQYVLQCLQEKNPALNVMLMDTCRKLPPQHRKGGQIHPGEIFYPMMKRNTVCGYATSVFYASYESDHITNGYFMKHLKEHITKKCCIQDVLWMVKKDFEADRDICSLQYPWVGSSLSAARCLTDNIITERSSQFADGISWTDLFSLPFSDVVLPIPELGASVNIKFSLTKGECEVEFCNAVDIYLCMEVDAEESLSLISHVQLDLKILSDKISSTCYIPTDLKKLAQQDKIHSTCVIPTDLIASDKKLVLYAVILVADLQKLVGPMEAVLCMKYCPTKQVFKKWKLSFGLPVIAKMELPRKHLATQSTRSGVSSDIEEDLISFDDKCSNSDQS